MKPSGNQPSSSLLIRLPVLLPLSALFPADHCIVPGNQRSRSRKEIVVREKLLLHKHSLPSLFLCNLAKDVYSSVSFLLLPFPCDRLHQE